MSWEKYVRNYLERFYKDEILSLDVDLVTKEIITGLTAKEVENISVYDLNGDDYDEVYNIITDIQWRTKNNKRNYESLKYRPARLFEVKYLDGHREMYNINSVKSFLKELLTLPPDELEDICAITEKVKY